MKDLFDQEEVLILINRIESLTPESKSLWGSMNVSQMLAHSTISMETAIGKNKIRRVFAGRIIGTLMKPKVLGEKPFSKNSPTDKSYVLLDTPDFEYAKSKLIHSIKEFSEGGKENCTTHPHPFFGKFTPQQWSIFQWKHLDHHLRQFGV